MGLSIVFQVVYRICRKDHSTGWSVQSSCDIVPELQQKNFHLSLWALWQPSSYHTSPNFAQRIHHNQRVSWMPFWFNRVDHSYRKLTLIFTSRDPTFLWQFFSRIWGSFENCMLKVFSLALFYSLWGIFSSPTFPSFFLLCEVFCMIMSWIKVNCLLFISAQPCIFNLFVTLFSLYSLPNVTKISGKHWHCTEREFDRRKVHTI